MNILLIFFALPIAVIIVSAILEKLLKCPIAVASLIFAIFLVVTFAVFEVTFLIATLVYTIIAFITAAIVHLFKKREREEHNICDLLENLLRNNNIIRTGNIENTENVCETVADLLTSNNTNNGNNSNSNCCCNRHRRRWKNVTKM